MLSYPIDFNIKFLKINKNEYALAVSTVLCSWARHCLLALTLYSGVKTGIQRGAEMLQDKIK